MMMIIVLVGWFAGVFTRRLMRFVLVMVIRAIGRSVGACAVCSLAGVLVLVLVFVMVILTIGRSVGACAGRSLAGVVVSIVASVR